MNPYTTRGQARIQPQELAAILREHGLTAGPALLAFERQRGYQAEAELDWLLKHNGGKPNAGASLVSMLRQTIGGTLVRVGERLEGVPRRGVSTETAPATGTLGMAK